MGRKTEKLRRKEVEKKVIKTKTKRRKEKGSVKENIKEGKKNKARIITTNDQKEGIEKRKKSEEKDRYFS